MFIKWIDLLSYLNVGAKTGLGSAAHEKLKFHALHGVENGAAARVVERDRLDDIVLLHGKLPSEHAAIDEGSLELDAIDKKLLHIDTVLGVVVGNNINIRSRSVSALVLKIDSRLTNARRADEESGSSSKRIEAQRSENDIRRHGAVVIVAGNSVRHGVVVHVQGGAGPVLRASAGAIIKHVGSQ